MELATLYNSYFFKNTYFPEHLSVAMTIKILKAMSNVIGMNFHSLTLAIMCTRSVEYLEHSQTSTMELFGENIYRPLAVN